MGSFSTLVTAKTVYCPAMCLTLQGSRLSLQLTITFELHSKSTIEIVNFTNEKQSVCSQFQPDLDKELILTFKLTETKERGIVLVIIKLN